jgi:imidazole glycerol-phosphate synthase subunit HisF
MLRKRLITVLTFNDGVLFRTKLFQPDYRYTLNFVDAWSVDEIVVLDVTRPGEGQRENFDRVVSDFARRCFVPLSAGGGIRSLEDVRRFMSLGADKVVLNTQALRKPNFITEVARLYGTQCAVVSIDAKPNDAGGYEVFSDFASTATGRTAIDWAREAEDRGAGEILITAIERDGWLQGYDLALTKAIVDAVSIPVLTLGGAGNWKHMVEGFETGIAGACTQNIYHFTEASIRSAKTYLSKHGIAVR